jgi:hypothetical protein
MICYLVVYLLVKVLPHHYQVFFLFFVIAVLKLFINEPFIVFIGSTLIVEVRLMNLPDLIYIKRLLVLL